MNEMRIVPGRFCGDVVPGGFRGDVVPGGFRGDVVPGGFRGDVVPGGFRGDVVPGGFRGDVVPGGFRGDVVPGGFRGNHVIYRTEDNAEDYSFDIERQRDGIFRIYIEDQPDYNGRSTDGHSTHRYHDSSRGQHYICVEEDLQPREFQHALNWAKQWAESTERYRKTGRSF